MSTCFNPSLPKRMSTLLTLLRKKKPSGFPVGLPRRTSRASQGRCHKYKDVSLRYLNGSKRLKSKRSIVIRDNRETETTSTTDTNEFKSVRNLRSYAIATEVRNPYKNCYEPKVSPKRGKFSRNKSLRRYFPTQRTSCDQDPVHDLEKLIQEDEDKALQRKLKNISGLHARSQSCLPKIGRKKDYHLFRNFMENYYDRLATVINKVDQSGNFRKNLKAFVSDSAKKSRSKDLTEETINAKNHKNLKILVRKLNGKASKSPLKSRNTIQSDFGSQDVQPIVEQGSLFDDPYMASKETDNNSHQRLKKVYVSPSIFHSSPNKEPNLARNTIDL
ncbi:unnamed protein product [Moneuplotes crassus]|uniref:Uncharacterized protein n=1 Tax=Euplotes crassus TaxID=5936 RepID=A0AAD1UC04_EUPCR|nr:unnamed protein product [Moneuplotes crassus]